MTNATDPADMTREEMLAALKERKNTPAMQALTDGINGLSAADVTAVMAVSTAAGAESVTAIRVLAAAARMLMDASEAGYLRTGGTQADHDRAMREAADSGDRLGAKLAQLGNAAIEEIR